MISYLDMLFPKPMFKQWGLKSKTTHQLASEHIFTMQHLRKRGNSAFSCPPKMQKIPSQNQAKNCKELQRDSGGKSYYKSVLQKQEAT